MLKPDTYFENKKRKGLFVNRTVMWIKKDKNGKTKIKSRVRYYSPSYAYKRRKMLYKYISLGGLEYFGCDILCSIGNIREVREHEQWVKEKELRELKDRIYFRMFKEQRS